MIAEFLRSDSTKKISAPKKSLTEKKIESFSNYMPGWSYGRGVKFSQNTIADAVKLVNLFRDYGFNETNAFPGDGGEIMITAYKGDYCCEITAYDKYRYDFIIERCNNETLREEKINFNELKTLIVEFRDATICNLSGLLTQSTSTQKEKDLQVWLSKIPQTTEAYLYLIKTAANTNQAAFASILKDTTPRYLVTQSYSG